MKLAIRARPYLSDVHAVVGHHVQLGVVEGDEVLFTDRLSGREAPGIHGGVASRLPLHLSATGIVLLAHAAKDFRDSYRGRCTGVSGFLGTDAAGGRRRIQREAAVNRASH